MHLAACSCNDSGKHQSSPMQCCSRCCDGWLATAVTPRTAQCNRIQTSPLARGPLPPALGPVACLSWSADSHESFVDEPSRLISQPELLCTWSERVQQPRCAAQPQGTSWTATALNSLKRAPLVMSRGVRPAEVCSGRPYHDVPALSCCG